MGKKKVEKLKLFYIATKLGLLCNCFNQDGASQATAHIYCLIRLASRKPFYGVVFSPANLTPPPKLLQDTKKSQCIKRQQPKNNCLEQGHNPLFRRLTVKCPPWNNSDFNIPNWPQQGSQYTAILQSVLGITSSRFFFFFPAALY